MPGDITPHLWAVGLHVGYPLPLCEDEGARSCLQSSPGQYTLFRQLINWDKGGETNERATCWIFFRSKCLAHSMLMGMENGLAGHTATGNRHCPWGGAMVGRGKGYGGSSLPLSLHITSVHFSREYVHTLLYNLFLKQYVINLKEKSNGRPQGLTRSLFIH